MREWLSRKLRNWRPIHLCWLFREKGWKIPAYLKWLIGNPIDTIFVDNFNSYNDGDLNGQGDWSGSTEFQIQGVVVEEGDKAVE